MVRKKGFILSLFIAMSLLCINCGHNEKNTDWIESGKDKHWMGFNETCAYLHAQISDSGPGNFEIQINYDDHHCRFFEKKASVWTLEFSDNFVKFHGKESLTIDGKQTEKISAVNKITVPAGLGEHVISLITK